MPVIVSGTVHHFVPVCACVFILHKPPALLTFSALAVQGQRPYIKNPSKCGPAPLCALCFSARLHCHFSVEWTEGDWRRRKRDKRCSLRMNNSVLRRKQTVTWPRLTIVGQARDLLLHFSQSQLSQDAAELPAHYEFPGDARQEAQRGSDPNLCQQVQEE